MSPSTGGTVAPGHEHVAGAFERSLPTDPTEVAQCSAHVDGEPVVDLWSGPPDLGAPVTRYRPEYGANGFEVAALTGARTSGHGGAGGTTAFADVDRRPAFGCTTNRPVLGPPGSDARASALVAAVYAAVYRGLPG